MKYSQDEIDNLIRIIPGGSIVYLLEGEQLKIVAASDDIAKGAGYTKEELFTIARRNPYEFIYEKDRESFYHNVIDCILHDRELDCSERIIHKNGQTLWVHFRGKVVGEMDGFPLLLATIQNISDIGNYIDIINLIPTGMGIYIVENGIVSASFLNEGYYRMLGVDSKERMQFRGIGALDSVHEKDKQLIKMAIRNAVMGAEELCTTIRMIVHEDKYIWLQLDGRVVKREGNSCTIYVSFTDVDKIKRTSYELVKSTMTLETSLAAGKQMCCEYDPKKKTLTGMTGANTLFGLPRVIKEFPDSLYGTGFIEPGDESVVKENIAKLDGELEILQFETRIRLKETYKWFAFSFKSFFDREKEYTVYICNFMDISLSKGALMASKHHLETVMRMNQDAVATFRMNLTQNICEAGMSIYPSILQLRKDGTVAGFFMEATKRIPSEKERQEVTRLFNRENILDAFGHGKYQFSLEHQFQLMDGHYEWFRTSLDLMENPLNNEIEGILYAQNINIDKIEKMILQEVMQKDYKQIVIYFKNRGEYYLFDSGMQKYGERHTKFWDETLQEALKWAAREEEERLRNLLSMEHVMEQLREKNEYMVSFSQNGQQNHRFQLQISYVNRQEEILLVTARDITDETLLAKLKYDSEHDSLTALYNREKTYLECDKLLKQYPDETFVFVRFDIQRFRLYNTFFGEKEGDWLLCYFADVFRELSHKYPYGVYGRSHADVFLLCFPLSEGIIEWNREFLHKKLQQYRKDFYLSGSSGIYIAADKKLSAKECFNRASLASKSNMNKQSVQVVVYDEKIEQELNRVHQITRDMRNAMKEQQFIVYLQPKYMAASEKPYGAEALVRWLHPKYGLIAPDEFIPVFEGNGLITQLDSYMCRQVCILLRRWIDEGREVHPISVNISRVSMYSPRVVAYLSDLIEHYQIPVDLLELELTESAFMSEPDMMKERILKLQEKGFKIMMDDFGSAYSSLNALQNLPFDYLKIDKKFVDNIEENEKSRKFLSAVIHMAAILSLPVITEGVETKGQRDFVTDMGVDFIQGFYYAKPMPTGDYEKEILS